MKFFGVTLSALITAGVFGAWWQSFAAGCSMFCMLNTLYVIAMVVRSET